MAGELYVYGILRADALSPAPPEGVEGRPVARLLAGPLAALVSEAPGGPVKATRRNLLAHSAVLQATVAGTCVLPMRFGVVMPGPDEVERELLRDHQDALMAQLDAFEHLVEVDLKLLCPEDVLLRSILAERPELRDLRDSAEGAGYHGQIRLGEMVAQAVAERRSALLAHVTERLDPLTVETATDEPAHEHMLVHAAFLAERTRLEDVDAAVRSLVTDLGPDIQAKYVGPLPPYHFVDTGSPAWA